MQKAFTFYNNTGYWFLLLIPLVFFGFHPSYFSVLFKPTEWIVHIHFVLMAIWTVILITQPFLYKYKKLSLHRKIGRTTYVLVPLLLISAFFMIRLSYYRFIEHQQTAGGEHQQVLEEGATNISIAFLYFGWLAILYSLAIINRRPSSFHARYMVATALTLLGPTVDRIVYYIYKDIKIGGWLPIETIAFLMIDTTLALLLWKDYQHQRSTKALRTGLIIFIVGQILYFAGRNSDAWQQFVIFILQAR